jgi:hypothetical protein
MKNLEGNRPRASITREQISPHRSGAGSGVALGVASASIYAIFHGK